MSIMETGHHHETPRSYGCSYGCGSPYDVILVSVKDSTTEFLCIPCYVRLAVDMMKAFLGDADKEVATALADKAELATMVTGEFDIKARGHNAPVATEDDDLIEAYQGVITEDELPEAFR